MRYAVAIRRLRRELAATDEMTGLPNLRGFVPIAEHHLRMADRSKAPVVFLFVRLEGDAPADQVRRAAEVLLEAVRDADLPARITDDTFTVPLTGEAAGAETLVLSRLVEAIAVHNAKQDPPHPLSLSVGSALYEPEHPHLVADPGNGRPAPARSGGGLIDPGGLELRIPRETSPSRGRCRCRRER